MITPAVNMNDLIPEFNKEMPVIKTLPQNVKNKIRILVLEDSLLNQKLAGLMLSDWGFEYSVFSNGKLGIDNLEQLNTYDLILMDIQMPEMGGYETTAYIRKNLKLELPIIAMTAHRMPDEKEKCLRAGMNEYISKPLDETELLDRIEYCLSQTLIKNRTMVNSNDSTREVINLDYLTGLSRGNTQFIQEMIDLFLTENPKEIEGLEHAIKHQKFDTIKQAAHLLQSSVPFMGLDKIIGKNLYEMEALAAERSTAQQAEAQPADVTAIRKIEGLFSEVKETCAAARRQLSKPLQIHNAI